jgi:hypothetical protein
MGSSPDSPSVMPARTRSRVSNGRSLFAEPIDQRLAWPRRLRDLLQEHTQSLGGEQMVSAGERSIIRRIATISVELELLERKFAVANGADAADLDLYVRASGGLRRLLEAVGLSRRARDISPPTLQDIANEIDAERDIEQADVE